MIWEQLGYNLSSNYWPKTHQKTSSIIYPLPASRLMNNSRAVTVLFKEQTGKHWNDTLYFTRLGTMFAFLPQAITLQSNDTKAFVVLFACLQVIRYNFSCFCGTNPIKAVYKSNTCFYLSVQKQLFHCN